MNYDESRACFEKADLIPGRSLTRSKAPGRLFDLGDGPLYAMRGEGALLYDVDGNAFIDMICALGAVSLGYGFGARAVARRGVYSLPSPVEAEAADAVLRVVAPWASAVRFVKTGSEATHAAYLVAKAVTSQGTVLVGDWAYHGWHSWCEASNLLAMRYPHGANPDTEFPQFGVAAVFVEPNRWAPTSIDWLQSVREYCTRTGALLVYDDMIYGLRAALGGTTTYFGVRPDLACFGKAMGNGAPIACVVGTEALRAHGELVSGTYSGDVDSLQAVVDTLRVYATQPVVATLWERGAELRDGLLRATIDAGCAWRAHVEGSILPHQRLRFDDATMVRPFAAAMAKRGVLWHPDLANVCYAHSADQIACVVTAAREALTELTP